MPLATPRPVQDFVEDDRREFMAVTCNARKPNEHFCNTYLGEIEISRPNVAKHRCRVCGIIYRHEVDAEGHVNCVVLKQSVASTSRHVKTSDRANRVRG